jgi:endonuclease/exonuclease/phosphatase family metal-dependent hydrolase
MEDGEMKKNNFIPLSLCLLVFLLASIPAVADFKNLSTQPPEPQVSVKILTLNVMQSASEFRTSRFQRIVDFLTTEPVHLLALQELSGGSVDVPVTQDSGADLANMLAAAGMQYGYYTEANWYDWYVVQDLFYVYFKVGVLPRYRMLVTAAASTGTPTDGKLLPDRKNVVMCGVDIPGFGRVNLYSVHVYSPAAETIATQIENLMQFVDTTDAQHPAMASIVAGDLNFSVSWDPAAYQKLLDHGFIDSYAVTHCPSSPTNCCGGDTSGCTYAVPGNPFSNPGAAPSRIDHLFVRGNGLRIKQSKVAFNGVNEDFVSDHSAVLTEITRGFTVPLELLLLAD